MVGKRRGYNLPKALCIREKAHKVIEYEGRCQINPRHNIFSEKRGVNERLCIEEVGVDLELCVHAHGNDVDPKIGRASCRERV